MVRFDLCRSAMALPLVIGLAFAASSARADMRVLDSNVAKYPRDALIKGNSIDGLKSGDWVRVLVLEDNKTKFFGDPPVRREGFGTRRPVQPAD